MAPPFRISFTMNTAAWLHLFTGLILGLSVLILGFKLLSGGLHDAGGAGFRILLARFAGRPWQGVLVGTAVAAMLHSSSVTTILIVGLVDAGTLSLSQAVPLIMGANVGTTMTAQLLATPLPSLGWVLGLAGAAMLALPRSGGWGEAAAGAGLIVLALDVLDHALSPLAGAPWFADAMARFAARPWMGVLAGAILTTIVLSSSVTVGLLQRLSAQGLIPLSAALPVMYGDNIGTTTDTLLAGLAAGREGRAAALSHLLFNLAGTAVFLGFTPALLALVEALGGDAARQVAHAHTLFNIGNVLLLLPFHRLLARASLRMAAWWDLKLSQTPWQ